VLGGQLSHRLAIAETAGAMHAIEFASEGDHMFSGGDFFAAHHSEQGAETAAFDFRAARHLGVFFSDVLVDRFPVQHLEREAGDFPVRMETKREVNVTVSLVRLLVEVDGADAILDFFEVRCDIHDIVHASHIAEQTDEAAFGEFGEFFRDADLVQAGLIEMFAEEDIAWDAGDVFLDQRVSADEIVDPVWREDVFQFQAVDPRGVGLFDVKVVRVVVEKVGDSNAKRFGISKVAEIDAIDQKVLVLCGIASDFEFRVDGDQFGAKFGKNVRRIHDGQPQGFAATRVFVGDGTGETA